MFDVVLLSCFLLNSENKYVYKGINVIVLGVFKISGLEIFIYILYVFLYVRFFVYFKLVYLYGIGFGFFIFLLMFLGFKIVVIYYFFDYKCLKWCWYGKLIFKFGELNIVFFVSKVVCVSVLVLNEFN